MIKRAIFFTALILTLAGSTFAGEAKNQFNKFVPKGWQLIGQTDGSIGGGIEYKALVIADPSVEKMNCVDIVHAPVAVQSRKLIVLIKDEKNAWHESTSSSKAILKKCDGGLLIPQHEIQDRAQKCPFSQTTAHVIDAAATRQINEPGHQIFVSRDKGHGLDGDGLGIIHRQLGDHDLRARLVRFERVHLSSDGQMFWRFGRLKTASPPR